MTVEPFFQRHTTHQLVDGERLGLLDQPADLDLPGTGLEGVHQATHLLLIRAELIEVVITRGDGLVREWSVKRKMLIAFGGVQVGGCARGRQSDRRRGLGCRLALPLAVAAKQSAEGAQASDPQGLQKLSPVEIDIFWGSQTLRDLPPASEANQHTLSSLLKFPPF